MSPKPDARLNPAGLPVAYQGEPGAFSERAVLEMFGAQTGTLPCRSFRQVFTAVTGGQVRYGILPLENSLAGSILENYDGLLEHDVQIVAECRLRVVHNLIANRGVSLQEIRRIYAHPQAAAQCDRFLLQHPDWTLFQVYDTAGSVKMIRDEGCRDGAAIAGDTAASTYGMDVLLAGIENDPSNTTRFVVISRPGETPAGTGKTTLVYGTRNEPGALLKTLEIFRDHGVNMTRLESRPIPGRPWEYLFYVDLVGTTGSALLDRLRRRTTRLKILGCYPEA
ncbi:MAG: prephenate dehydratase [Acidobacteriota bacterium]